MEGQHTSLISMISKFDFQILINIPLPINSDFNNKSALHLKRRINRGDKINNKLFFTVLLVIALSLICTNSASAVNTNNAQIQSNDAKYCARRGCCNGSYRYR